MPTLNWIGKEAVVKHHKEVPFRLLEPVPELSCGDADSGNLIVQGDNLHALKALLPRYAGQVKCIYIDPPYNTGNEGAELAAATRALPPDGLHDAAQALVRALEGAGEQRADYWTNRVAPYLHAIWPKTRDNVSPAIAESLGRLCVAAQDAFPEALTLLRAWLQPPAHPDYLVHRLHEAGLCGRFPEHALDFLSLVIGDQTQWPPSDLGACLDAIRIAAPELEADPRFERLMAYLRQHGRG